MTNFDLQARPRLRTFTAIFAVLLLATTSCTSAYADSTEYPTTLAHKLVKQHRYYAAAKSFEDALKTAPKSAELYCELADCFSAQEFYEPALLKYLEAKRLAPDDQSYKLRVAVCLTQLQRFDEANKEFESVKFVKDEAADYYFSKALMQSANKDFSAAIKSCRKALKSDATYQNALIELATCYSQIQQNSKADHILSQELKRHPNDLDLLSEFGYLKICEQKTPEALKIYDKMISIDPDRVDAYRWKGYCYEEKDDWKKALECYKQVTGLPPGDPTISKYIYPLLLQHDEFELAAPYVCYSPRQTSDTAIVVHEATQAVVELPANLKKKILTKSFWITVTPTLLEYNPLLSQRPPRGYPDGLTWEHVAGFLDGSVVVISERVKKPDRNIPLNLKAYYCTLHEIGHAFDASQKSLSNNEQFKYCYSLDCAGLGSIDKKWYAYYLQPDEAGRSELFASLFELYLCRLAGRTERNGALSLSFPHCYDFVFRKLE